MSIVHLSEAQSWLCSALEAVFVAELWETQNNLQLKTSLAGDADAGSALKSDALPPLFHCIPKKLGNRNWKIKVGFITLQTSMGTQRKEASHLPAMPAATVSQCARQTQIELLVELAGTFLR